MGRSIVRSCTQRSYFLNLSYPNLFFSFIKEQAPLDHHPTSLYLLLATYSEEPLYGA